MRIRKTNETGEATVSQQSTRRDTEVDGGSSKANNRKCFVERNTEVEVEVEMEVDRGDE